MPLTMLDSHLAGCAGCRDWLAMAQRVNRAVRLQAVEVPDLTARVLAAVSAPPVTAAHGTAPPGTAAPGTAPPAVSAAGADGRRQILRVAVAAAAVAQLALAVPVLLGVGGATGPHATREMASFDIALAVGFALAAYRPRRAAAFVPVAFVLAVCLAATSAMDMVGANTALIHEVGHLSAVVQAALLWGLGRVDPGSAGEDAGTSRASRTSRTAAVAA